MKTHTILHQPARARRRARLVACVAVTLAIAGAGWMLMNQSRKPLVNSLGMTLVYIPAGTAFLGSTEDERAWALAGGGKRAWIEQERLAGGVDVPYGFWIGITEVTVGQFSAFVEDSGFITLAERGVRALTWDGKARKWGKIEGRSWRNPGHTQNDHYPVICLTWSDARNFCNWLTRRERNLGLIESHQAYRLPAEYEWVYAARGSQRTRFAWGDESEEARRHANIVDATPLPDGTVWDVDYMPWKDGYAFTAPVKAFAPTWNGLYDMHGNVWEWCRQDVRVDDGPRLDWYVLRGGSWDNLPSHFRCATRRFTPRHFASDTTGFRVVLSDEAF